MSKRQFIVMWVTIGVIVLMCLFPPWTRSGPSGRQRTQYDSLLDPPRSGRLDGSMLLVQIVPVVLIGGGLMLSLKERSGQGPPSQDPNA